MKGYDYAQGGVYFVTICTQGRENLFGEIKGGEMRLSGIGEVVKSEWLKTPEMRPNVTLDEWIIMPNHIHGIITIDDGRGTLPRASVEGKGNTGTQVIKKGTQQRARAEGKGDTATPPQGHVQRAPTVERFGKPVSNSIPTIVRMFKSSTTKKINEMRGLPYSPVWQRNYYEHIIRNEGAMNKIREYIAGNPARWGFDRENPGGASDAVEKDFWEKVRV